MPAASTWPMITSETCSGARPARSSTLRITSAPRSEAGVLARFQPNLPMGVRVAPTMTISSMCVPRFINELVGAALHVATGRGLDRPVLDIAGGQGCLAPAAAVPGEPLRPFRPPAAAMLVGAVEPGIRVLGIVGKLRAGLDS